MPNINKIKLSGTSYDIQDANATKTVELTQAQYDALVTGGTVDSNTFYIITDGEMFNPSGKVDTSAFTEFSGAVETELSGKTDESAFTAHTGDSTIHVTTAQTAAWNAKSDFSGSYNDLTDKPTIPTVPTSNTAFTNDAQYATSGYVDSAVSGKANSSDVYTKSQTSGATEISTALNAKLDTTAYTPTDLSNYYQKSETSGATQISDALSGKQDTLSAGTNITIVDNVISAEGGGGGVNVVQTTGTSITDVMSQDAVTTQLNKKANKSAAVGGYQFGSSSDGDYIQYRNVNNVNIGNSIYYPKINGKGILTTNNIYARNNYNFQLVETSAITTSVTSSSTDAQVPSAKAVNDKLGGLSLVKLTQAEYDALATKDSNTLYVING